MQEKIDPSKRPTEFSQTEKETQKTSQKDFNDISEYLEAIAKRDLLKEALEFFETLQHKQSSSLSRKEHEQRLPQNPISKNLSLQMQNIKTLQDLFGQLRAGLQDKNEKHITLVLLELTKKLSSPREFPLPAQLKASLHHNLKAFFQANQQKPSIDDLLFDISLSQDVSAAQKDWGNQSKDLPASISKKLKEIQSDPSSIFSAHAGSLLEQGIASFSSAAMQENEKALAGGVTALLSASNSKQAVDSLNRTFQSYSTSQGTYALYLDELQHHFQALQIVSSLAPALESEIKFLRDGFTLVKKIDPSHPNISASLTAFEEAATQFPTLSPASISALNQSVQALFTIFADLSKTKKISSQDQKTFLGSLDAFFSNFTSSIEQNDKKLTEKAIDLEKHLGLLSSVTQKFEKLEMLLTDLKAGKTLSPQEFEELTQNLEGISKNYPQFTQDEKNSTDSLFEALATTPSEFNKKLTFSPELSEKGLAQIGAALTYFEGKQEAIRKEIDATVKTKKELQNQRLGAVQGANDIKDKAILSGVTNPDDPSLPSQFANFLAEFSSNTNEALMELSDVLEYFNGQNSNCLQTLDQLSGWSAASANFNLSSYLNTLNPTGSPPTYSGDPSAQIQNELNNAQNAYAQGNAALNDPNGTPPNGINQQLAAAQAMQPPDPTLVAQLSQEQAAIMGSMDSCQHLITLLQTIKVVPGPNNTYTLTSPMYPPPQNVASGISSGENDILNGQVLYPPNSNPPTYINCGLPAVYGMVQGFQQNYAGLSTNQQLKLSQLMTGIQQAWTLVTSIMQAMNTCYMTFAQAISQ